MLNLDDVYWAQTRLNPTLKWYQPKINYFIAPNNNLSVSTWCRHASHSPSKIRPKSTPNIVADQFLAEKKAGSEFIRHTRKKNPSYKLELRKWMHNNYKKIYIRKLLPT